MTFTRRLCVAMVGLAVGWLALAGYPQGARAGGRSLCGPAGCALPKPNLSQRRLLMLFTRSFWKDYRANYCDQNIHRLLRRLKRAGANLRAFEVLYLVPSHVKQGRFALRKNGTISPLAERNREAKWRYHVILRAGSQIWDLDYQITPTAVKARAYFKAMWNAPGAGRVGVRRIPATDYLREYVAGAHARTPRRQKGFAYYAYDQGGRYRLSPISRVLNNP